MAFNIEAARKDGVSDADIANHLAGIHRFNIEAARADGVSDTEIADHLAQRSTTLAAVKNSASDLMADESPKSVMDAPVDATNSKLAVIRSGIRFDENGYSSVDSRAQTVAASRALAPKATGQRDTMAETSTFIQGSGSPRIADQEAVTRKPEVAMADAVEASGRFVENEKARAEQERIDADNARLASLRVLAASDTPEGENARRILNERGAEIARAVEQRNYANAHPIIADTATDFRSGVAKVPGAFTGLLDIAPALIVGGRPADQLFDEVGKITGFQPAQYAQALEAGYSDIRKQGQNDIAAVWDDETKSWWDVTKEYAANPGVTAGSIIQSLPSMAAGGAIGRATMLTKAGLAPVAMQKAAITAGAIGEGAIMAGQQMDGINRSVDARTAALASLATGIMGAAVGKYSGALASKFGIRDVDTMLAGGTATAAVTSPFYKRIPAAMVQEGIIEEGTQSSMEQMLKNIAEDKPVMEGVNRATVEGILAGSAMGGAVAAPGIYRGDTAAPVVDAAAPTLTRASQIAKAGIAPQSVQAGAVSAAEVLGAPEQPAIDQSAPTLTRAAQAAAGITPLAQHTGTVDATSLPVQKVAPPIIEPAIQESAPVTQLPDVQNVGTAAAPQNTGLDTAGNPDAARSADTGVPGLSTGRQADVGSAGIVIVDDGQGATVPDGVRPDAVADQIKPIVEQLVKLRRNAGQVRLAPQLDIAVNKAKAAIKSGTGKAADFTKLAKVFKGKDAEIHMALLSIADTLKPAQPQKASTDLLQRIKQLGGIDGALALDITGEQRAPGGWKFAFNKGGTGLDDLATMLASDGFMIDTSDVDGGVQQLRDMIRNHIGGERNFKAQTQEAQGEAMASERNLDALAQRANELGINWRNLSAQQLSDAVYEAEDALEMERLDAAENEDEVVALSDSAIDDEIDIPFNIDGVVDNAAPASWLGEDDGQKGVEGSVQGAVTQGQEAGTGSDGGTNRQEAGTGQEVLQSYTAAEVAQREASQAAQERALRAEEDAAKAEQAKKDQAAVDAKKKAHAENPENFVFGESKKDALKPMGSLFNQPAKPTAESNPDLQRIIKKAHEVGVSAARISEIGNDIPALTEEIGRAVMAMGSKQATAPTAKQSDNALTAALNEYEETGEIGTVDELADRIESMIDEGSAPDSLTEALKQYRDDQAYDRELSGRGDMDAAEVRLIAAIRAAANESKPEEILVKQPYNVNTLGGIAEFEQAKEAAASSPENTIVRVRIEKDGLYEHEPVKTLYGAFVANGDGTATWAQARFPASKENPTDAQIMDLAEADRLSNKETEAKIAEQSRKNKAGLADKGIVVGLELQSPSTYVPGKKGMTTFTRAKVIAIDDHGIAEVHATLKGSGKTYVFKADANSRLFEKLETQPDQEQQATAILDRASVTGKDRLDIMRDFKDGKHSLEDLEKAYPDAGTPPVERGSVGAALTQEQKKSVLKTLVDVYKTKGAEKESKGLDRNGNERIGYAYQPELFEKSDITGAMVRYHVTMPDGRIAHPTELFPEYTQSDIDAEMSRRQNAERNARLDVQRDYARPDVQFDDKATAAKYWDEKSETSKAKSVGGWATIHSSLNRDLLTNGEKFIMVPSGVMKNGDMVEALAAEGWKPSQPAQAEQPASGEGAPIEDFGEKISGARKEYAAAYKDKMDAAKGMDILAQPLSKSWPEPDYQKLVDAGNNKNIVGLVRSMRDEIPNKPGKSYRQDTWARQVELLRDTADKLLNDQAFADKFVGDMKKVEHLKLDDAINGRAELYALLGHEKSLKGIRISRSQYGVYNGVPFNPPKIIWEVTKDAKATAFGNMPRTLGSGDTRQAAIDAFTKAYSTLDTSKEKDSKTKFDLYANRYAKAGDKGQYFIGKKVGRNVLHIKDGFDTVKEARVYAAEHNDELTAILEQKKAIPNERYDTNQPRVGQDMRNGQDVTPQMFSDAFGFRGVQFGNYVEGARRQKDLNDAYDALMDLAAVLDIPPKALSLNGELGLAFGARGTGGKNPHSAHYEPGQVVINLTKGSGAGSLAHEWWHALDSYFSRVAGKKDDFATDRPDVSLAARDAKYYFNNDGIRKEMIEAFGAVVKAINGTAIKQRSGSLDARRTKEYWGTGIEMSARSFERYVIAKLHDNGFANDYLANVVSEEYWNAAEALGIGEGGSYPYPTESELPAIRAGFDHFFQTIETKETDKGVALFSFAGKGAQTADTHALTTAQDRLEASEDADVVRQETGWFKGADGKWRFEIDDSDAKLKKPWPNKGQLFGDIHSGMFKRQIEARMPAGFTVGDVLDHPALFAAYPHIADIALTSQKEDGASFSRSPIDPPTIRIGKNTAMSDVVSKILHEVQHAIQEDENFAVGGTTKAAKSLPQYSDAIESARNASKVFNAGNGWGAIAPETNDDLIAGSVYRRLAGEVESRNTQSRQSMTAEQRRNASPESTEDVKASDVIVVFNGKEMHDAPTPANVGDDMRASKSASVIANPHTPESAAEAILSAHTGKIKGAIKAMFDAGKARSITAQQAAAIVGEDALYSREEYFKRADQIERALEAMGLRVDREKSNVSVSTYIYAYAPEGSQFKENEGEYLKIRISNHKLPDSYVEPDFEVMIGDGHDGSLMVDYGTWDESVEFVARKFDMDVPPVIKRIGSKAKSDAKKAAKKARDYEINELSRKIEIAKKGTYSKSGSGIWWLNKDTGKLSEMAQIGKMPEMNSDQVKTEYISRLEKQLEEKQGGLNPDIRYSNDGRAVAFFNQADGVTYFIADHLSKSASAQGLRGLAAHEIGVHALHLGRDSKEFQSILKQLELLRKSGNKAVVEAFDRVPEGTPEWHVNEEALAYLVQKSPDLPVVKRIIAWFRNALREIGKSLPEMQRMRFMEWAASLNESDIVFMAQDAMAQWTPEQDVQVAGREDVMASRSESAKDGTMQTVASVKQATQALRNRWLGFRKIEIVQSDSDLPQEFTDRVLRSGGELSGSEGWFDPKTKTVYLVADNLASQERAVWVAIHEVVGHGGIRMLGSPVVDALNHAAKNGFVDKLAQAIAADRGETFDARTHTDEAIAELAAATITGNVDAIMERYGVKVPMGMRSNLLGMIKRVVDAVRQFIGRVTGKPVEEVSDGDVLGLIRQMKNAVEGVEQTAEHGEGYALASRSNQPTLRSDIPSDWWLNEKKASTTEAGRNEYGAYKRFGTATGSFTAPVSVSVSALKSLSGLRGEQGKVRQSDLDWLVKHMSETGSLPLMENGKPEVPYIEVDQDGKAWVSEGNHRIMAAAKLGWETLPVEIRYFNGGERADGTLNPKTILAADTPLSSRVPAQPSQGKQQPRILRPAKKASMEADTSLIDKVVSAPFKLAGWNRLIEPKLDRLLERAGEFIPEKIKAGMVSDYGLSADYIDRKAEMKAAEAAQSRKSAGLVEMLAALTRAESRIAYQWMQTKPDAAIEQAMLEQLPEESRATLETIKKLISDMGKEAVRLGQMSQEAYERNNMAYLHRTYAKHVLEPQGAVTRMMRARALRIKGNQYKGRGIFDEVRMDAVGGEGVFGRKLQQGQADKSLVGEKLIRFERRDDSTDAMDALPGMTKKPMGKLREVAYWPASTPVPQKFGDWVNSGTFEVRDTKGGKLVVWRDFTPDERERMGELDEVRYAVAQTLQMMTHDIEVGRFFAWTAKTYGKAKPDGRETTASESMLHSFGKDEWVQVPSAVIPGTQTKKYGALAGLYIPGAVWNDIRQTAGTRIEPFGHTHEKVLQFWKKAKTAWSPAVHMNNVMANFVIADWHDLRAADLAEALKVWAYNNRDGYREIYHRFEDSGALGGMFLSNEALRDEIAKQLESIKEELTGEQEAKNEMTRMAKVMHLVTMAGMVPVKGAKLYTGKMEDAYQFEDAIFRLAAFTKAIRYGKSDIEAGRIARHSFLNYDINAPWIQAARHTLLPFVSFFYRALPMALNTVKSKPWKVVKLMAFWHLVSMAGYMMSGGDEDDERELLPKEKQGSVWGVVPKMVRMPWNHADDAPYFLDIRRWVPVGDVADIEMGAGMLPPWATPGGPVIMLAEMLLANKSFFTEKEIVQDTDTQGEKLEKRLDHLFKGMLPNVPLPNPLNLQTPAGELNPLGLSQGSGQSFAWSGIEKSMLKREGSIGEIRNTPAAIASAFGIKASAYPSRNMQASQQIELRKKVGEIQDAMKKIQRNFNNLEDPTVAEQTRYEHDMERQRAKLEEVQEGR